MAGQELLVVEDLKKHFPVTQGVIFQRQIAAVKAVDGVSFTVREGETLGVVGESGLREVDDGALHRAAARALGCKSPSRAATSRTSRARTCGRSGAS